VLGDADQLTRVVQNLLVNALQYAPAGSPVVVSVEADASHATLQVIDTGPGIPTDLDAFTRFGRGDSRGTGLGLYTVKQIVELHEGSIDLSATPGGGTTVTVHLPLHDPAKGC
jgi:two-component system, OmpR family, sensor kinase